ncbi:MAG: hypothetical protein L0216_00330 [Planctomycetales bacterium]|nr:hypothetical protein [Planctomycetales bacterium]
MSPGAKKLTFLVAVGLAGAGAGFYYLTQYWTQVQIRDRVKELAKFLDASRNLQPGIPQLRRDWFGSKVDTEREQELCVEWNRENSYAPEREVLSYQVKGELKPPLNPNDVGLEGGLEVVTDWALNYSGSRTGLTYRMVFFYEDGLWKLGRLEQVGDYRDLPPK